MHPILPSLPMCIETQRLTLRAYQPGDGNWYYMMSQRNRHHLERYERGNAVMKIFTEADAEAVVRELAAHWLACRAFFMGVFLKGSQEFVAQIYMGVVNWEAREFELGYFADAQHEGRGYVSEAARAALHFLFDSLNAQRVRLECDDTNVRSYKVAERIGMNLEAHFPHNKENPDGSITGTYHYRILRSEFVALSKPSGEITS